MNDYQAYMLRMWQDDNQSTMRFSLESPVTGERIGFADLQTLVAFLSTSENNDSNGPERGDINETE